jgi:hypothetical protein
LKFKLNFIKLPENGSASKKLFMAKMWTSLTPDAPAWNSFQRDKYLTKCQEMHLSPYNIFVMWLGWQENICYCRNRFRFAINK